MRTSRQAHQRGEPRKGFLGTAECERGADIGIDGYTAWMGVGG